LQNERNTARERNPVIGKNLVLCCGVIALAGPVYAQVELKTYADRDGYVDVQKLTCAQLANTFQEDADYLTVWYSGWYNGLAKKHMMQVDRAKSLEHQVIVHCKANPGKKVIEAIDVVFKEYRAEKGIKMKQ
jgi:HdeA/HdeB family